MQNWFNIRNSILTHYIWNTLKRKTVPSFQKMQKKHLIKLTYIHESGRKFSKQWGTEKSFLNQMIKGIPKNLKQWSANYTPYRSKPSSFSVNKGLLNKATSTHFSTVYRCFLGAQQLQQRLCSLESLKYLLFDCSQERLPILTYSKHYQKLRLYHQWSILETFTLKR